MSHDEDNLCDEVRRAFLAEGKAFPTTPSEVEEMERFLEENGYPEIPEHLRAEKLADALINKDPDKIVTFPQPASQTEPETGLARAARNGCEEGIPDDILELMEQDRENNES